MKTVKVLLLTNSMILISEIEEISSELGEPDCKLINPFVVKDHHGSFGDDHKTLEKFMMGYTTDKAFMMSSDKILTLAEPTLSLFKKYEDLTKE